MKKSYSLVLGGGSARGLAHIGVLKYIEEKNISIDEISGTSIGAIIGACFALGKTSKEIEELAENIKFFRLFDLNLRTGIFSGNKIYKILESIFGDNLIENTKIPLKIVATNLNTSEKQVFKTGKIVDCIRASLSLPVILSPFEFYENKYLDGGLKANLPILDVDGQYIIAVSVRENPTNIETHKKFFGLNFLRSFFGFNYSILRRAITILNSTNEDLSIELAKERGKDVILLTPESGSIKYYDFTKIDESIQNGYKEAILKLGNL